MADILLIDPFAAFCGLISAMCVGFGIAMTIPGRLIGWLLLLPAIAIFSWLTFFLGFPDVGAKDGPDMSAAIARENAGLIRWYAILLLVGVASLLAGLATERRFRGEQQ